MPLGYDKPLYLLPFDHRTTFAKELLRVRGAPTPADRETIRAYKGMIYEAFLKSLALGVPEEGAAVLLDEEYGEQLIRRALSDGVTTCLTIEKSGQEEFQFEYGEAFGSHVKRFNPTFVKALVRYHPDGDRGMNGRQRARLKTLSDFARREGYKLLLEVIIPPTPLNLIEAGGETARYDRELRPTLALSVMRELQEEGIEPDIWKLEGFPDEVSYRRVVAVARNSSARKNVGVIVLGRGEERERVISWLKAGRGVEGVIGFAVGRTVFLEPLRLFKEGHLNETEAIFRIARNYADLCDIFLNKNDRKPR